MRALIGLRRWSEADASYSSFLASMPPDVLARTRASDWRLLALLAAKNGRMDEALDLAERSLRYRNRLYGANHPLTQEAAGMRGLVRLRSAHFREVQWTEADFALIDEADALLGPPEAARPRRSRSRRSIRR